MELQYRAPAILIELGRFLFFVEDNLYTALLIDGGHLRHAFKANEKDYSAENIETFANSCFETNETIYRIFYYDAPQYEGELRKPISRDTVEFKASDTLLSSLAKLDNFAIRKGRLRFNGWKLKQRAMNSGKDEPILLEDRHFSPQFQQKGVDMALGLDVAAIAETGRVDQFMVVSADTDMAPALKYGRVHGMKAIIIKLEYNRSFTLHDELSRHSDIVRQIEI